MRKYSRVKEACSEGGNAMELALGRRKNIPAPMRFHQELLMLIVAVLSFGMAVMCKNDVIATAGTGNGSIFVYLGLFAVLFS